VEDSQLAAVEIVELRPAKELAVAAVVALAPECTSLLIDIRDAETWRRLTLRMNDYRKRLKLDAYITLYDSEAAIAGCFVAGVLGPRGMRRFSRSLERASRTAQQDFLDYWTAASNDSEFDAALDAAFNEAENYPEKSRELFESLPGVKRERFIERAQYFGMFSLAIFHNLLSVMIHGRSMVTLLSAAKAGDDEALLKAAHIDKQLSMFHPYVVERIERAHASREERFLARFGAANARPAVRSGTKYPGLYVVLSLLQSMRWLDSLRHVEILEICDRAGLDRFQSRIEDVGYLTKRLIEFRRWQKTGGLSMH